MSNTDRMSLLERWAIGMEKLEQYYEGKYGPPATLAQLPAITTCDGMLEAIADGLQRAKRNINKKSPTYHSDSVAYVKTVPSGDVHYASLEQIGGKTLLWNQLAQYGDFVDSTGWTFGKGTGAIADNVATVTCGSSGSRTTAQTPISFTSGHKFYLACDMKSDTANDFWLSVAGSTTTANSFKYTITTVDTWNHVAGIITPDVSLSVYYIMATRITSSVFKVRRVKVIDLTLMYGTGNEPSTTAEVEAMFPADVYSYNAGTLLSAGVTEVVSKKADTTEIATYAIPAEVQALEGYGLSAGSLYNYVDFEAKKFVQNVGFVDLSALAYGYGPSVGWSATLPNVKNPADDDTAFNGLSATLKVTDRNTQAAAFDGGTDAGMVSVANGKVYVGTGSISIVPSGTLIYELDEPVETDISAYLTDDGLIEVEVGGTLEFPNQNGNDYRMPVPSSETFVVGEP